MMKIEKEHRKSTLMNYSKEQLVDYCLTLEHNNNALSDSFDVQYQNVLKLLEDMKIVNETYKKSKQLKGELK